MGPITSEIDFLTFITLKRREFFTNISNYLETRIIWNYLVLFGHSIEMVGSANLIIIIIIIADKWE